MRFVPIGPSDPDGDDPKVKELCVATKAHYSRVGFHPPWIGYFAVDESGAFVGTCAFKTRPNEGRVEIAYHTFAEFEGKGIATAMARHLISIAHAAGVMVYAQTLPEKNASNHLLQKLGFRFAYEVMHPEDGRVWEWHLLQVEAH